MASLGQRTIPLVSRFPLITFFVLAYLLAWVVMVPLVLLNGAPQFMMIAACGPAVAALITNRFATGQFAFWQTCNWALAPGITALSVLLVILAYVVLPGIIAADPRKLNWSILASLGVFNYSTLLGGPLGEEPGWRGYALPRLELNWGATRGTLLLGFLWAAWHLPLFLRPGWESAPFWIYTLLLEGLTFIISFCVNLSRFSMVPAVLAHAAFNTVSKWLGGLLNGVELKTPVRFDLVLALSGLAVALVLVLGTGGRLAYGRRGR